MNPLFRDMRIAHCEQLRARAVHDVPRLRRALHLIGQIAEHERRGSASTYAMHRIAQLARAALVVSTPPDDDGGPDTDHRVDHLGNHP
ncbi:hypothetical protein NOV72_05742 [Caballeronia novacaledonica]|uniref:Uncharacterized protein n=1 Tax=Caballeronia novacaledonica TaxID=1544861 RepID=A0A2U3IE80_9BURK|nr:hypothetical protein [Caballeronia novacaledonica]SPB18542.1 hypothetical protein NOV72_05742 [Caballeronia novacaledonica]